MVAQNMLEEVSPNMGLGLIDIGHSITLLSLSKLPRIALVESLFRFPQRISNFLLGPPSGGQYGTEYGDGGEVESA